MSPFGSTVASYVPFDLIFWLWFSVKSLFCW